MTDGTDRRKPSSLHGRKHRGVLKLKQRRAGLAEAAPLRKPDWLRVANPMSAPVQRLKSVLRERRLHTVCEEASCPNIGECFSGDTATFMILGDICTRRCPFCDVAHGRPLPPDPREPVNLAETVQAMGLTYVVITSVDRDDLEDGGATHFRKCIRAVRNNNAPVHIEILTPDFRKCLPRALVILSQAPPDVFNHNIETVPRLYKGVRPGADYRHSLTLLRRFKELNPETPTKSGLMLGLGETTEETEQVLRDLRDNGCNMVTIGQYLRPTRHHIDVQRYLPPSEFDRLKHAALDLGFDSVYSGPLVRSSYHAETHATDVLKDANG